MSTRVLHVAAVDFTVAKLLAPQLDALIGRGYDVRVACRQTDPALWRELTRFEPIDIPFPRDLRPGAMLAASARLSRQVRRWKPHVLHLHTPAASLPVRALPHPRWSADTRVLYTVHGYLHVWPPASVKERLVQRVEKWEARRTDVMLFQSAEDYEQSRARDYPSSLVLLGNGVEDAWFEVPRRQRVGHLQLLFVGRLVREKGILDLLDALKAVPDVHLHVAGSALDSDRDPVEDELRRRLDDAQLTGRVTLYGMLPRDDLRRLYEEVDALCLPSYREGVPRSVIEALAAGRPVVATDIRGSRELILEGSNGHLVPVGDVTSLAGALRRLAALDDEPFTQMGVRAALSVDPARRETTVFERLVAAYGDVGVPVPRPRVS